MHVAGWRAPLKPQYLTYPHVQFSVALLGVVQHQVGVSVVESSHQRRLQQHGLHLLHPPHPQALVANLGAKLTGCGLEEEHAAERQWGSVTKDRQSESSLVSKLSKNKMWMVDDRRRGRVRGKQEVVMQFPWWRRCSVLMQSHKTLAIKVSAASVCEKAQTNSSVDCWWDTLRDCGVKDLNGARIGTSSETPPNHSCSQGMWSHDDDDDKRHYTQGWQQPALLCS